MTTSETGSQTERIRATVNAYLAAVASGRATEVAALYAEDATLEDPPVAASLVSDVLPSPSSTRHRGHREHDRTPDTPDQRSERRVPFPRRHESRRTDVRDRPDRCDDFRPGRPDHEHARLLGTDRHGSALTSRGRIDMQPVTCRTCGNRVLAEKHSEAHTSIQWLTDAAHACPPYPQRHRGGRPHTVLDPPPAPISATRSTISPVAANS